MDVITVALAALSVYFIYSGFKIMQDHMTGSLAVFLIGLIAAVFAAFSYFIPPGHW